MMRKDATLARRALNSLAAMALAGSMIGAATFSPAQAQTASAEQIAAHFSQIRTMTGEFVQFGPRGEQTGGKFFIERPGRIRFNYDQPSNFRVVADGKSVVITN